MLAKWAAKQERNILYVANRKSLIAQVKNDIKGLGLKNVDVMSYQALEKKIKAKAKIPQHNYIVSDEYDIIGQVKRRPILRAS